MDVVNLVVWCDSYWVVCGFCYGLLIVSVCVFYFGNRLVGFVGFIVGVGCGVNVFWCLVDCGG